MPFYQYGCVIFGVALCVRCLFIVSPLPLSLIKERWAHPPVDALKVEYSFVVVS